MPRNVIRVLASMGISLVVALPTAAFQSTQGYTGLLLIPNAQVQGAYSADVQWNNMVHVDRQFDFEGQPPGPQRITDVQNVAFSVGMLPRIELSGRIYTAYRPDRSHLRNDLSGNLKAQLWDFGPAQLAIGWADFAGEVVNLRARYVVGDYRVSPTIRLSAGVGRGGDRLDGFFGGAEWQVLPWLAVLADYDADKANVGLRANSPAILGIRAYGMVSTQSYGDDAYMLAGGLAFDFGRPRLSPSSRDSRTKAVITHREIALPPAPFEPIESTTAPPDRAVSVHDVDSSLWGWFPTHAFHDQCAPDKDSSRVAVREHRYGIPLRVASVLCDSPVTQVESSAWSAQRASDFDLSRPEVWQHAGLQVRVEPIINSAVATEFGIFDYSVGFAMSTRLQLPLGLAVYTVHVEPLFESDDYRPGRVYSAGRIRSRKDETMLQWIVHPYPGVIGNIAVGQKYLGSINTDAMLSEVLVHSPKGAHQLQFAYGDFDPRQPAPEFRRRSYYRYGYRYLWFSQDLSINVQHGCYLFDGDCGQTTFIERYMGPMTFLLFHRISGKNEQVGGFGLSFPLTGRKQFEWSRLRVGGTPTFGYALQTTINTESGANVLRPFFMFEPRSAYDTRRFVLDRNRGMPGYMD